MRKSARATSGLHLCLNYLWRFACGPVLVPVRRRFRCFVRCHGHKETDSAAESVPSVCIRKAMVRAIAAIRRRPAR
eukprot:4053738-Lingulodinium_polyedra.AAC.1